MELPITIQKFIDTTNSADNANFVATFTESAELVDWGRRFTGLTGIASWNKTDNIGKQAHFEAVDAQKITDIDYIVTLKVTGNGFNGVSDFKIEIQGDLIQKLIIEA
ncbi:MAG: nuclear transport factor 2 family protein [Lactobacillaceae bacterium]|jgi:hypothetical protein|nr:nuclear transport factor 2 family protein [Lactobacillaceae bacterium]